MSATSALSKATATAKVESLGSVPEFDATLRLRAWFARWLTTNWERVWPTIDLHGPALIAAHDGLTHVVSLLRGKLPFLTTGEQLRVSDGFARRFSLSTTRAELLEAIDEHFNFNLSQDVPAEDAEASKAWRGCNARAVTRSILKQAGVELAGRLYPEQSEGEWRLELETVVSEFCTWTPFHSPLPVELTPGVTLFVPAAPRRQRAAARLVLIAIKKLCPDNRGAKRLADFIVWVLKPKQWPRIPGGLPFDVAAHFGPDVRCALIRKYPRLSNEQTNQDARRLWHVLRAVVENDELRDALLRLAIHAELTHKGWLGLRKKLTSVFLFITWRPSDEERFRDFARMNFSALRDLDEYDQLIAAQEHIKGTAKSLLLDPDSKNSFSSGYRRAMKKVTNEI